MNYSTTFALTESPISESGSWENTVSATWTAPVSTTGGNAVGINSSGTNDSVARLTGSWGRDQTITGIAFVGGAFAGSPELEFHLRMVMTPGAPDHIDSYEIDIVSGNSVAIVKWQGGQGNFAILSNVAYGAVVDGDSWEASAIGGAASTLITVKCNGVTVTSVTDVTANTAGNPGIGFDAGSPADGAKLGWKSITATDGVAAAQPIGRGML